MGRSAAGAPGAVIAQLQRAVTALRVPPALSPPSANEPDRRRAGRCVRGPDDRMAGVHAPRRRETDAPAPAGNPPTAPQRPGMIGQLTAQHVVAGDVARTSHRHGKAERDRQDVVRPRPRWGDRAAPSAHQPHARESAPRSPTPPRAPRGATQTGVSQGSGEPDAHRVHEKRGAPIRYTMSSKAWA